MDRFIASRDWIIKNGETDLKSNMDRFIVKPKMVSIFRADI